MFQQTFVGDDNVTRKTSSVLASFFVQSIFIVVATLVPLIYTDTLPVARIGQTLLAEPPPPPPPPPPPAQPAQTVPRKVPPRQFDKDQLMAPKQIPKEIAQIVEQELPPPAGVSVPGGVPGGILGGTANGVMEGIIGDVSIPAPPPPTPAKREMPTPKPPQRIQVGGQLQAAKLISQPKPPYPPLARQARVQGTVRFNAMIGKDGTIQNLQLVSGHPLLIPAATEAVRQWRYQPTLLNEQPVEVVTQIDVNFTLSQ